jgi:hypothetical protein
VDLLSIGCGLAVDLLRLAEDLLLMGYRLAMDCCGMNFDLLWTLLSLICCRLDSDGLGWLQIGIGLAVECLVEWLWAGCGWLVLYRVVLCWILSGYTLLSYFAALLAHHKQQKSTSDDNFEHLTLEPIIAASYNITNT